MPRGVLTDYAAELGQAECLRLVQDRLQFTFPPDHDEVALRGRPGYEGDPETGRLLWVGRTLPEGYAQIKRRTAAQRRAGLQDKNSGKNFMFHRIAFVAQFGHDITQTASHLCDRPRCFNPQHIWDESMQENNRRKGCAAVVCCPSHDIQIVDLCIHSPKCVRPPPPGVVCCLDRVPAGPPPPGASPPRPSSSQRPPSSQRPESSSSAAGFPSSPPRVQSSIPGSSAGSPARLPLVAPPSSEDSDPVVVDSRRRRAVRRLEPLLEQILSTDPGMLDGSDQLREVDEDSDNDDMEGFVVGDDIVEMETQPAWDFPSDF